MRDPESLWYYDFKKDYLPSCYAESPQEPNFLTFIIMLYRFLIAFFF